MYVEMYEEVKIILPIYWHQSNKKPNVLIGENWYRNAHYHTLNKAKKHYKGLVFAQLLDSGIFDRKSDVEQFRTHFDIYWKNAGCDPSNIDAAIIKFFLDPLQDYGVIPEDNAKYHMAHSWSNAGRDKDNPRCECFVYKTRD